jgi:hypothetical protein
MAFLSILRLLWHQCHTYDFIGAFMDTPNFSAAY